MMSEQQFERFIINLKLLNAKERDHLMRYAYLGETGDYDKSECYLSDQFTENLKPHLAELWLSKELKELEKLKNSENSEKLKYLQNIVNLKNLKCVFAGMDYHLDWLYVALKFAIEKPTFDIADKSNLKIQFPMEIAQESDIFREISGSQEDIDLIAVFKNDVDSEPNKFAILFIEAKGCADFDRTQLARKLIRLDHILKLSGVVTNGAKPLIEYRLILASPIKPDFKELKSCRTFASAKPKLKPGEPDKYESMRKALEDHLSGIGEGINYFQTPFPQTFAIKRIKGDKDTKSDPYSHWIFINRNIKKDDT